MQPFNYNMHQSRVSWTQHWNLPTKLHFFTKQSLFHEVWHPLIITKIPIFWDVRPHNFIQTLKETCFLHCQRLKVEAADSSTVVACINQSTQCHGPLNLHLHTSQLRDHCKTWDCSLSKKRQSDCQVDGATKQHGAIIYTKYLVA